MMAHKHDIQRSAFSGGTRYWCALAEDSPDATHAEWSFSRPGRDPAGQLVRLVDVPSCYSKDPERLGDVVLTEREPVRRLEAVAPNARSFTDGGIEIGTGWYCPLNGGCVAKWETSGALQRLCGSVQLAHLENGTPSPLRTYLLALNWDLRFVRVGVGGQEVLLQVVVPDDEAQWLRLAHQVLETIYQMLQPQTSWWRQPRHMLQELLQRAGL
jgi:hypothetical protein